jgi:glutaredoxin
MFRTIRITVCLLVAACILPDFAAAAESAEKQSIVAPPPVPAKKYPSVVIYTLSTCPHCREAKEYFSQHNIPFINREVDTDDQHMADLMTIYDAMGVPEQKRGVPLIIIGNNIRLQGFNKDKIEEAFSKVPAQ